MKINIVDCFCLSLDKLGNRAAVITNFYDHDIDKQSIAESLGLPVTVFVSDIDSDIPLIEYFYPKMQMPLCLHGTIAAGEVVLNIRDSDNCNFITAQGCQLNVSKNGEMISVKVGKVAVPEIDIDKSDICRMLNLESLSIFSESSDIVVASVGSPKLLIQIKSKEYLTTLSPNFSLIKQWSLDKGVNGLYVYAPASIDDNCDFIARGFNPKTGHNEDAATGVASAALSAYLKRSIIVEQGENIDCHCRIVNTYIDDDNIFVGGAVREAPNDEYTYVLPRASYASFNF